MINYIDPTFFESLANELGSHVHIQNTEDPVTEDSDTLLFARNVDIVSDKVIPIPIGLERADAYTRMGKRIILDKYINYTVEPVKLCYLNARAQNNSVRAELAESMSNKEWCTVEMVGNGRGYEHYVQQILSHKFTLSPEGYGFDCYRTWESLILGRYPVVTRRVFIEEFAKHLPILVIDSWEEVTEELLNSKYTEFKSKDWNWDFLTQEYWKELIKEKTRCTI